ncbi:MAG: nucleoside-diphosphate sugar epimerase/dehydratase [Dehalococcoidia bacterium]
MENIPVKAQRPISLGLQLVLVAGSYTSAFLLSTNFTSPASYDDVLLKTLPVMVGIKGVFLFLFGLTQGWWRYSGVGELLDIFKGVALAQLAFFIVVALAWGSSEVPASVYLIDFGGNVLFLGGARLALRLFRERRLFLSGSGGKERVLIVGAGSAGGAIRRTIAKNPDLDYELIGFVDDDSSKQGARIHGLKVLGTREDIPKIVAQKRVDEIILSIPSATNKQMQEIIAFCRQARVPYKTVPSLADILSGSVTTNTIREVRIDDLLGRHQIPPNDKLLEDSIRGQAVLITGAAGSIGSELARQCLQRQPGRLILLDQSESGLSQLYRELSPNANDIPILVQICDVTDKPMVEDCLRRTQPQLLFHAAAYKDVPLMEANPLVAVRNNVLGTKVVADLACEVGLKKFVLVSTDKAVNPTSVMGATKRVAELYVKFLSNNGKTRMITVRFGNVLGSQGSVVPLFKRQIATGGPVTVTHPDMERYFMTIKEAAQLILHAAAMGQGGEIFVLEMGEPVKILDMAKELIALSGFGEEGDIPIAFIGLRPGEKLREELFFPQENPQVTEHSKIYAIHGAATNHGDMLTSLERLLTSCGSPEEIYDSLKEFIPEYTPSSLIPVTSPSSLS